MGELKTVINGSSIKEVSMVRLIFLIFILFLSLSGCNGEGKKETTTSSLTTMTESSGYLQVSVFPGDINANIGEQVTISCSIVSLINTPISISSIDLVLFDSNKSEIRTNPLNLGSHWSASVTYTIVGDEASYRLLVKFSINPANPQYFSEYTDTFAIKISS